MILSVKLWRRQKTSFRNVLTAKLHNVPEEVLISLTMIAAETKKGHPQAPLFPDLNQTLTGV
jgi:hypothetical protein